MLFQICTFKGIDISNRAFLEKVGVNGRDRMDIHRNLGPHDGIEIVCASQRSPLDGALEDHCALPLVKHRDNNQ